MDQRENDLFVMLTYPNDIPKGFFVRIGEWLHENFDKEVAFVAIKNVRHSGVGYFIDTGEHAFKRPASIPLTELKDRVMRAFGLGAKCIESRHVWARRKV